MGKFKEEINRLGETVSYYAFSLGNRNSTTNRKVGQWTAAADLRVRVLTQPSSVEEKNEGCNTTESLVFLSEAQMTKHSVIKWQDKYYDIIMVEEVYWNRARDYYKATTVRRLEFLGA